MVLSIGDSFTAETKIFPAYKSKSNCSFTSTDNSIADVNGEKIVAVSNGTATVNATLSTHNGDFSDSIDVVVKDITYDNLVSSRTIKDFALTRVPESIEVGAEFSCQVYALSDVTESRPFKYQYADDNLVYFTSSNPSVVSVKNGVLLGVSEGTATITVHDIDNLVSKSFVVSVTAKEELAYTNNEIYYVPTIDMTDAESMTIGIADALLYASENGFKKIVFPNDIYVVSPAYGTISIPTHMIVDFNGSVIQIEPSAMTLTGYTMFSFSGTSFSKITNAKIYGERYLISGTGAESCRSISFAGKNYKSGIENCEVSNSCGFNVTFGFGARKIAPCKLSIIEAGGLSATGEPITENYSYRTNAFINISSIGEWFGLGNMQGYQGYLYMSARVYDICFYDENYQFISKLENCLQYYHYDKPSNAKYAKIAYNYGSAPTSSDPDYHAIAHIYSMDKPINCFIKDCTFKNNYSTAIVPNAGDNLMIDNCVFEKNGVRDPASQIDWEDGRNNIKGHIVRNCRFIDGGAVHEIGGDGIAFHNNVLIRNILSIGSEVQNSRTWLNQFVGNRKATIATKTDSVFSQNYGTDGASYEIINNTSASFAVRETENTF